LQSGAVEKLLTGVSDQAEEGLADRRGFSPAQRDSRPVLVRLGGHVVVHLQHDSRLGRDAQAAVGGELNGARAGNPSTDERCFDAEGTEAVVGPAIPSQFGAGAGQVDAGEHVVHHGQVVGHHLEGLEPLLFVEPGVDGEADELVLDLSEGFRRPLGLGKDGQIGILEINRGR